MGTQGFQFKSLTIMLKHSYIINVQIELIREY